MRGHHANLMWHLKFAHDLARRRHELLIALAAHDHADHRRLALRHRNSSCLPLSCVNRARWRDAPLMESARLIRARPRVKPQRYERPEQFGTMYSRWRRQFPPISASSRSPKLPRRPAAPRCATSNVAVDYHVRGVSIDTRSIEAGSIFVALRGAASDGHGYLPQAAARGAAAAVVAAGRLIPRLDCIEVARHTRRPGTSCAPPSHADTRGRRFR